MSDSYKKINKILKSRYVAYILSFLIPAIVILISFIIGGFAPFGNKEILTVGKSSDLLFKYYEMYDHFKSNDVFSFTNSIGLTHDYISDYFFNLSDPTNLIILLFSKNSITSVIDILYLIKVALCGLSFYIFINNRRKTFLTSETTDSNAPGLAFSIAFALSQYFISEGTNINYLLSIALVPIICMGIDNIINGKSSKLYLVATALSIYFNFYISMITALLSMLHYVVNISIVKTGFVKKTISYILSSLCSVLLSLPIILSIITGSEYSKNISLNFVRPKVLSSIWNIFSQLTFNPKPSVLSQFDNGLNLYFGLLTLVLFFSFLVNPAFSIKKRIIYFVFVLFILCATFNSTTNYLLNGFKGYINNTYVFGYFLIFIILTIAYESLLNLSHVGKIRFSLVFFILSLIVILTIRYSTIIDSSKSLIYSLEIIILYYLISLIFLNKNIKKSLYLSIISVCFMGEVIFSYASGINMLGKSSVIPVTQESHSYLLYQASSSIHNIDKNSTIYDMYSDPYDTNPFISSILGVDYIIDGEITDNTNRIKNAVFDSKILSYEYNNERPFDSANIFSKTHLNTENIFKTEYGDAEQKPYDNPNIADLVFNCSAEGDLYVKAYHTIHLGNNNSVEALQTMPIDRFNTFQVQYASLDNDTYTEIFNNIRQSSFTAESILSGDPYTIHSDEDENYLYLPIESSKNLSVSVNGKSVDTNKFIYNTTLIPLKKGDNTITLHYSFKYFYIGLILSIITLILVICVPKYIKQLKFKKNICDSVTLFIKNNIVYVYIVLIFTSVFILCQMITGSYPFGHNSTLIDDGISQIYGEVVQNIKLIKEGKAFTWINQDTGLNRDMTYYTFTRNVMHFWDVLILRFLPENMYFMYYTFIHYLAFLLNPFSIVYYLTHKHFNPYKKTDLKLVLIGCIYGLSSYALVMFTYECFRFLLYTPLIALGIEKIIYEKKPVLYIIFLSFMMIYDPYYAFQLCELLVLFFITYKFDNFKHFVSSGIQFALSSVFSAGIAAFRLLTFYSFSSISGYSETDSAVPSINSFYSKYLYIFNRYIPLRWSKALSPDNSRAAIYVGILLLLFIPLYMINKRVLLSIRIKRIILLVILFLAFNNKLLNFVFHGFHYQTLVPNRFAYFFVFIVTIMIADSLPELNKYKTKTILSILIAVTSLYAIIHYASDDLRFISTSLGLSYLIICLLACIISIIQKYKYNKHNQYLYKIIISVMFIDLISNGIYLLYCNMGYDSSIIKEAQNINKLSDYYPEITESFNNTTLISNGDYHYNVSYIADIESPSFFYSGADTSTLNLYNKYNIMHDNNTALYGYGNPLADMMMHTKYQITDTYDDPDYNYYSYKGSVNNLNLYENPFSLPLGFVIENSYKEKLNSWDNLTRAYYNLFDYQNDFSNSFDIEPIYDIVDIKEAKTENDIEDNQSYYSIGNPEKNEGIQDEEYSIPIYIHIDTADMEQGYYYVSLNGKYEFIMYLNELKNEDIDTTITLTTRELPDNASAAQSSFALAKVNLDNLTKLHEILSQNTIDTSYSDGKAITSSINTNKSGMLYISLPFNNNWEITVDGQYTEAMPLLGGIGINIQEGSHQVVLRYNPNGLYEGIIISVSTLLILFLLIVYKKKKNTKSEK